MTIDFVCQKCDGAFEIDADDLIDRSEKIECPHCEARATQVQSEDFAAALQELRLQIATLSKKFAASVSMEADDISTEDEEDEDEDEDDESDDEDSDDDDDDDDDDSDSDDDDNV